MYKILDEVKNFIEKTMKPMKVEVTAGRKNLTEAKIQRGKFHGIALSPSLVIAMIPLNHILGNCTGRYKLTKSQEKINHMFMDDIELFAKNKTKFGNSNTGSENIQLGHTDGIWHRKMRNASNEKQKTIPYGRNGTTKSRKN